MLHILWWGFTVLFFNPNIVVWCVRTCACACVLTIRHLMVLLKTLIFSTKLFCLFSHTDTIRKDILLTINRSRRLSWTENTFGIVKIWCYRDCIFKKGSFMLPTWWILFDLRLIFKSVIIKAESTNLLHFKEKKSIEKIVKKQ